MSDDANKGGSVLALDESRILFGLIGEHANEMCLREDDGTVRRATPAEVQLALLVSPLARRWRVARQLYPLPKTTWTR